MEKVGRRLGILLLLAISLLPSVQAYDGVDVQGYRLDVEISPPDHAFRASATVRLGVGQGIGSAELLLSRELSVQAVEDLEGPLEFERHGDGLRIYLRHPGQDTEVTVDYAGISEGSQQGAWSSIGPDAGYMIYEALWYPLVWGDDAPAEVRVRIPQGYTVVTVGELTDFEEGPQAVYAWRSGPVRGISLVFGRYLEVTHQVLSGYREDGYLSLGTSWTREGQRAPTVTEAVCYLYPEDSEKAGSCASTSTEVMGFYSSYFGSYPYKRLRVVEAPASFFGGHGDPGFVILSRGVINRERGPEFLAHEIAHNWWGVVTFADGERNLHSFGIAPAKTRTASAEGSEYNNWLVEGFATYSALLYIEHAYGRKEMLTSLDDKRQEYIKKSRELGDTPVAYTQEEYDSGLYHAVVYSKGAYILHMLRSVVGEETFSGVMKEYARRYAFKKVTIKDFQEVAEDLYGEDLGWFFQEWLYSTVLPDYAFGDVRVAQEDGSYRVEAQVLPGAGVKMPIDVTLHTSEGEETKRIWLEGGDARAEFISRGRPLYVALDEGQWLLDADRTNNLRAISYRSPKSLALLVSRFW